MQLPKCFYWTEQLVHFVHTVVDCIYIYFILFFVKTLQTLSPDVSDKQPGHWMTHTHTHTHKQCVCSYQVKSCLPFKAMLLMFALLRGSVFGQCGGGGLQLRTARLVSQSPVTLSSSRASCHAKILNSRARVYVTILECEGFLLVSVTT